MRLAFLLVIFLCGLCSAIPTDGSSTSSEATASAAVSVSTTKDAPSTSSKTSSSAGSSGSSGPSASTGGSSGRDFDDDDDDDDDDDSQMGGDGLNLPLSSAILLSSHHGHHVCIPDVLAFSLLGSRGYPFGALFPYHHTSPAKLQQELMFLKAFTKAGQHVWKSIASGHQKLHGLENFAKVAGAISTGMNAFAGKGGHGLGGIASGISSGLSAAQHVGAAIH